MKSLRESLFDVDLVTKRITFGDLFEVDEEHCTWESRHIQNQFNVRKIRKDTKISDTDADRIIFKGIVKIIEGIEGDLTASQFAETVKQSVEPYILSRHKKYKIYVWNGYGIGSLNNNDNILDWGIVRIDIVGLTLAFIRKYR